MKGERRICSCRGREGISYRDSGQTLRWEFCGTSASHMGLPNLTRSLMCLCCTVPTATPVFFNFLIYLQTVMYYLLCCAARILRKKKKEKKKAVAWFWMHRHRVTCSVYFASEQPSTNRLCVSVGAHSGGKRSHVPGNSGWFAFLFAFAFFNRLVVIGLTFLFARLSHWRGLWDVLRYWFHHQNALQCGIWFNTRDKSSVFYWLDDDKKQVSCCVMVRHQTSFLRLSGWVTLDMWNVPSTSYCVCMVTLQELDCSVAVLFSLSSSTRHSVFCAVFIAICLDRTRCDIVTLWWFCWTWICWSAEPTVDAKIFMFFVCRGSACQ